MSGQDWAAQLTLRFVPGRGWRITAPAELPGGLAAKAGLNWGPGRWQSPLYAIPPSGEKRRMREQAERGLYKAQQRIRQTLAGAG